MPWQSPAHRAEGTSAGRRQPNWGHVQPGFDGVSVYESVTLNSTNFPVSEVTGTGGTNSNSQIVDQLSVTADSPLPSEFSASVDQYLGVGGFVVRHNTITQTATGPSIDNLGPYN